MWAKVGGYRRRAVKVRSIIASGVLLVPRVSLLLEEVVLVPVKGCFAWKVFCLS